MNPHSALATGASPEDIAHIDTIPEREAYVLFGGVVGGPDRHDNFWDMRSDWVQNEVALDYVAPMVTLAAQSLVNASGDPFYVTLTVGSNEDCKPGGQPCDAAVSAGCSKPGWRTGQIIMGSIVGATALVVVGLFLFWIILEIRRVRGKY